ncbi:MAG TPA: inner membrane-spanning protein YciB [Steroidobacteraceae bacterium]|nr:inner membrane-spanning protein YciB [Steroidobacteraceae bacterium]
MSSVLELSPLAVFGVAYYTHGIYVATAALMASMLLLLVVDLAWQKRIPAMHALSAALVFAFGSATLILHNQRFIQWKPTVLFWLISLAFLGSMWIGRRTLTQRLLEHALGEPVQVTPRQWRTLNALAVVFYGLLGGANLLVAFNLSERAWVNFKLFGLSAATVVFTALQIAWLARRLAPAGESAPAA